MENMETPSELGRYSRQGDLIPRDALINSRVTVIGVGAIGRQVSLQLAAMGVANIQLIDFDMVDESNIATQGYYQEHVGMPKVQAMCAGMRAVNPTIGIECVQDRFRPALETGYVVFCCVDNISAREVIWRALKDKTHFWCDGRMVGEHMRVITATTAAEREYYPLTLFKQEEAYAGRCTAKGTIYTANIVSGLMLHQFTRWLRGIDVDRDVTLSLLASQLILT